MATYHAKPAEVEAVQITKGMTEGEAPLPDMVVHAPAMSLFRVRTLHGWRGVDVGDWVITPANGWHEVVSDSDFVRLYEPTQQETTNGKD